MGMLHYTTQNLLRIAFLTLHISAIDTPVRGSYKCVLKLSICHVHPALFQYLYFFPLNQFSYLLQIHKYNAL